jgi:hypothetical protein
MGAAGPRQVSRAPAAPGKAMFECVPMSRPDFCALDLLFHSRMPGPAPLEAMRAPLAPPRALHTSTTPSEGACVPPRGPRGPACSCLVAICTRDRAAPPSRQAPRSRSNYRSGTDAVRTVSAARARSGPEVPR